LSSPLNTATSPEKLVKAKPKGEAEDEDSEEEAPSNEEPKGDVEEVTGEQSATMETDSEQPSTRHTPNSQNHNRMNPYNLDPPCQSSPKSEIVMCLYAMEWMCASTTCSQLRQNKTNFWQHVPTTFLSTSLAHLSLGLNSK
jgi:hypothetical protein